jgi:hypothetical protein
VLPESEACNEYVGDGLFVTEGWSDEVTCSVASAEETSVRGIDSDSALTGLEFDSRVTSCEYEDDSKRDFDDPGVGEISTERPWLDVCGSRERVEVALLDSPP